MNKPNFNFYYFFPKSSLLPTELQYFKVRLTPAMAQSLLTDLNVKNRDIRLTKLKELEVQLRNGLWDEDNGETIIITRDGIMSSGQHRCQAVINTGITIDTHICINASSDAIETLDTGASRTAKDLLTIRGFKYPDKIAGLIKLKKGLTMGMNRLHPEKNIPNVAVLHLAQENTEHIYRVISKGNKYYNKCRLIKPTDFHAFYDLFSTVDEEACDRFFDYFVDATMLNTNHPIYRLYEILSNDKTSKGIKYGNSDKRAMIVIAWNYFYTGKDNVKSIKWDARKSFPRIEGLDYEMFAESLFPQTETA